ncbi:hypothetical protein [Streptomyces kanamyceticus]|uniref:Uncharacterized protein n=1 Tax=Streptomyces kanamyceticus TaxID=1967 RepID=A0A5J6GEL0_STRKN|nr:hypothetical protein [Streptomyces kanamyceticus]QEU93367.1 hypothetical protein CP970_22800 [Streptomyces kanamyceticus]
MSRKPTLITPSHSRQGTAQAASALDRELRAAGLASLQPVLDDDRETPYVRLNRIDAVTAAELARLLHKGMRSAYKVVSDLRAAVRAHGLEDFPVPYVYCTKIHLGDIPVATADRLALLLGAPPQPGLADVPDWPEARQVFDRLNSAFAEATRGGFMDMYLHPYCQRCDGDPAISLGELQVRTARRLVTALQGA